MGLDRPPVGLECSQKGLDVPGADQHVGVGTGSTGIGQPRDRRGPFDVQDVGPRRMGEVLEDSVGEGDLNGSGERCAQPALESH